MPNAIESLVSWLKSQLGKPYELGANGPDKWDCSSLTQQAFFQNCNINLPRNSTDQYSYGTEVQKPDLQTGDLIFYDTGWSDRKPNHVGVYIGENKMINANSYNNAVKEESISSSYWTNAYYGARRVTNDNGDADEINFPDVPTNHEYYSYIKTLYDKGFIKGYPNGTFKPENSINRAELLKIVLLAFNTNISNPGASPFSDVQPTDWFYPYVVTAHKKGIVQGYSDGKFKPGNNINRVEALKIIFNTAGTNLSTPTQINFSDVDKNSWYFPYLNYAIQHDMISPTSPTTAEPQKEIQRQEVCKIIALLI